MLLLMLMLMLMLMLVLMLLLMLQRTLILPDHAGSGRAGLMMVLFCTL